MSLWDTKYAKHKAILKIINCLKSEAMLPNEDVPEDCREQQQKVERIGILIFDNSDKNIKRLDEIHSRHPEENLIKFLMRHFIVAILEAKMNLSYAGEICLIHRYAERLIYARDNIDEFTEDWELERWE